MGKLSPTACSGLPSAPPRPREACGQCGASRAAALGRRGPFVPSPLPAPGYRVLLFSWCLPSPGHTVVRAPHSVVPRWWCECGFLMMHIHKHVSSDSAPTPSRWVWSY